MTHFPNIGLVVLLISAMGMSAAEPLERVPAPAQPFPLQDVRLLEGPFKQIQELHRTGMVGQLEPDRLLFQFRKNAGLPQPAGVKGYGSWDDGFLPGEYAAHYLIAAARMYAATGDISFRDKANYMVKVLEECQDKLGGGYLSAFPAARLDRLEANPHRGLVEYYTIDKILAGLANVAQQCDNRQALEIAAKLSDYVAARLAKLSPAQIEALFRTDYTGNPVNEFGGMAEALADLYAVARQQGAPDPERHLKLAALFNRDWLVDPLLKGEDKLNGMHANTHTAQACGLARCALATGDPRLGTAADAYWKLLAQKHSFVNGGNGFDEKLRAAGTEVAGKGEAALRPMTCESCGTYNMLKLTRYLFERAPAASYGDYYETALLNHILASIAPDHGKVMYHMSVRPGDYRVHIDEPCCCQGSGIEHAARFGEAIYFHRGNELWVSLYIASTLDWHDKGLKLRLDTRYPEDGLVRLSIAAAGPVDATVNFRIPGWLQGQPEVRLNGHTLTDQAMPGTFLSVARTWKDGDILELRFPLGLRTRPSMDDPRMVSFFCGPVLLAGKLGRDGMPASDIGGVFQNFPPFPVPVLVTPATESPAALLKPVTGKPTTYVASMVRVADRKTVEVELAPFYQVHHQRYAVYWKVLKPDELDAYAEQQAKRLPKPASFIGNAEAEKSRNLQGERTSSGPFSGRMWRAAENGGWFSYRLPAATGDEQELVCTYWGGETGNRVFDIIVEDTKVATQTLRQNKPDEFFDVAYPIPAALVHGKQFVTVRFQAHPGATAGGVFHCIIVKSPLATMAAATETPEPRGVSQSPAPGTVINDRILFNWHNFLSGCSTWNEADWNRWTDDAHNLGYNGIMVHAYGNNPMVSFTFNGKTKPIGYLTTTQRGRDFATMHVNDVRRLFGGAVFDKPVFGADAALGPEENRAADARRLMQDVFAHAASKKMNVLFAVDVDTASANPQELILTLPETARFRAPGNIWLANPDTKDGYQFYKAQAATLLTAYPQITTLVVWFRDGGTPWMTLKASAMPAAWQEEYQTANAKQPQPVNMFAIGKILRAFDRALNELDPSRIRLAAGSWGFGFLPGADASFPADVTLIGLDYSVLSNQSDLATPERRQKLAQVGAHRPLIPVIWAHHDDGAYFGRSYTPFDNFRTKLVESKASGFGVIHWMTRPFDLYIASHIRQVCEPTKDEPLRVICERVGGKAMGEYLYRWITEAPLFGRETTDFFFDKRLTNVSNIVASCRQRLKLLEGVTSEQADYYRGLEEFVIAFHETHELFQRSQDALKQDDPALARQLMAQCRPEAVIEQFARFSSIGGITRGEQGVIVSLNLRWLNHIISHRQVLGLEPVRIKFGPTQHDPLAQYPGKFTFYFDADRNIWEAQGEAETGARAFTNPDAREELARTGIVTRNPLHFTLRPMTAGNSAQLLAGAYQLRVLIRAPFAGEVEIAGNNRHVDLSARSGLAELKYPVTLTKPGNVPLTMTGNANLYGLILEPEKWNVENPRVTHRETAS